MYIQINVLVTPPYIQWIFLVKYMISSNLIIILSVKLGVGFVSDEMFRSKCADVRNVCFVSSRCSRMFSQQRVCRHYNNLEPQCGAQWTDLSSLLSRLRRFPNYDNFIARISQFASLDYARRSVC